MELKKDQIYDLKIEKMANEGEGIGRLGKCVVFVPYSAAGDELKVRLTRVQKNYARAVIDKILKPSADRVVPECPYFSKGCGGCDWHHIGYDSQLKFKKEIVEETLERLGGIKGVKINDVLRSDTPLRYRNRMQVHFGVSKEGRDVAGFYAAGTHDIVEFEDCLIHTELCSKILNMLKSVIREFKCEFYDEDKGTGCIRHLVIRQNKFSDIILIFVTAGDDFPGCRDVINKVSMYFTAIISAHQNINPSRTHVIFGKAWKRLWGDRVFDDEIHNMKFVFSPGAFLQVNVPMAEKLYSLVEDYADPKRDETVLDLYSGIGPIALLLSKKAGRVYGVEELPVSVRDARSNIKINRIENAEFFSGKAEVIIKKESGRFKGVSTAVLDPPRTGCAKSVIEELIKISPRKIIYVSCNPATFARDARLLAEAGYGIKEVQPVDMFPQTSHIELVSKFEK